MGETVTEGVVAGVLGTDGVTGVGETVGVVVVAVGVTDGVGVMLGVVEGAGVDVVAGGDWTGPTRLGPVLRWPVSIKAIASPTTVLCRVEPGHPGEALRANAREQPVDLAFPVRGSAHGGLGDQQWCAAERADVGDGRAEHRDEGIRGPGVVAGDAGPVDSRCARPLAGVGTGVRGLLRPQRGQATRGRQQDADDCHRRYRDPSHNDASTRRKPLRTVPLVTGWPVRTARRGRCTAPEG